MKIHILFSFVDSPTGGGNQFLKALRGYFQKTGIYASDPQDADVILFNSFHNAREVAAARRRFPEKVFVHRVDGSSRIYNNKADVRDHIVRVLNESCADATIFQSQWSRVRVFPPGRKPSLSETVIINAPDPDIFNAVHKQPLAPGRKLRLLAASWSTNMAKGFDVYQWLDEHLDYGAIDLVFAGRSPVAFKNIRSVGSMDSRELATLMRESDIFITASRNEACPNVLLEALHSGLPAIAIRSGAHEELLKGAGELFDEKEQLPGLIEHVRGNYASYQKKMTLPTMGEVGKSYMDFCSSVMGAGPVKQLSMMAHMHLNAEIGASELVDTAFYHWRRFNPAARSEAVRAVTPRALKVYVNFDLSDGPAGGGNQFLKAFSGVLRRRQLLAKSFAEADVILFNNYHQHEILLAPENDLEGKVFIHRVAGLARLQAHPLDQRDKLTKAVNKYIADATIFQTEWARQAWTKDGMPGEGEIVTICNASDPSIFNREGRKAFDPNRKLRVIAASWSANWNKGFATYKWLDDNLDFTKYEVLFVGNAPLKFKNIKMILPVPSKELAALYRTCDVYVTAVKHEPCSNALIEAMHCGLVPVAYNDGGNPEIIGKGGCLFRSPDEIPAMLEDIRGNYQKYQAAILLPDLEKITDRYVDFMNKILAKCTKAPRKRLSFRRRMGLRQAVLVCSAMTKLLYWWGKISRPRFSHQQFFDALTPQDIAIDCGANVGKITARMARRGARVYAFEPNPYAFNVLNRRFSRNKKVTCLQNAVWTGESTVKLFLHEHSSENEVLWSTGSSILEVKSNVDKNKSVEVKAVDLAAFIERLDAPVKLLKIDIEGAECDVINKLIDRGLQQKIEAILVETHDHKVPELKDATNRLRTRIAELGITNIHLDWI